MELKFYSVDILKDIFTPIEVYKYDNKYRPGSRINGKYITIGYFDDINEERKATYEYKFNKLKMKLSEYDLDINEAKILNRFYLVFKTGDVFNIHGHKLIGGINHAGYIQLTINHKTVFLHRIIAYAFIDNPNNYFHINHIDGNKLNNNVNNLEWCTSAQNSQHAYRTGLARARKGEESWNHKLNEEQVIYIKTKSPIR